MPFALHDAQSVIAREYSFVSWAALRSKVAAGEAEPQVAVNLITGACRSLRCAMER